MRYFNILWTLISLLQYPLLDRNTRDVIRKDFMAWAKWKESDPSLMNFVRSFASTPEFRSVVYYRIKNRYRLLPSLFLKRQEACFINAKHAGGGLVMVHGFSSIINCRSIGNNCTVFQQVTIGYSKGGTPQIGDNCVICCGAKILGAVTIGNNVIVGAGAVVIRDIPDNSVVAGNPGRIVSRTTDKTDLLDNI